MKRRISILVLVVMLSAIGLAGALTSSTAGPVSATGVEATTPPDLPSANPSQSVQVIHLQTGGVIILPKQFCIPQDREAMVQYIQDHVSQGHQVQVSVDRGGAVDLCSIHVHDQIPNP